MLRVNDFVHDRGAARGLVAMAAGAQCAPERRPRLRGSRKPGVVFVPRLCSERLPTQGSRKNRATCGERGTCRSVPAVGKPSGRPVVEDVNIHLRERKGEGQDRGGVLWARVILWSAGGRGLRGTWLPEGTQGTRQSSEWATCPLERLLQVKSRCCIWERSRGTSPRPRRRHLRHRYELFKHCIYLI